MLFPSPIFLFAFLPVTLAVYLALERRAWAGSALAFLGIASLFFYAWWNPLYLPLLLGSMIFNFYAGRVVSPESRVPHRKLILVIGVAVNLAVLAGFKYADFAIGTVGWMSGRELPQLGIALPLAISFFTFQQIAFLVDSHEGRAPEKSFVAYCMFITFFPHLIAGPIVHHKEMMPQFAGLMAGRQRSTDEVWDDLAVGFAMFAIGLAKKVMLADQFAIWSDNAFRAADGGVAISFFEAWLGTSCFALQIYFDFSGYSDMALGLARLFGVRLPLNFNSPYKATSIIDFWRRWHITLSRFLRDYLYRPLGGNRAGVPRQYLNIMIVMLLGGLWHGAAWTFVIWGGLHGLFIVLNHAWRYLSERGWPRIPAVPSMLLTMLCVLVAWAFFRAETFAGGISMVKGMAGINGILLPLHWEPAFVSLAKAVSQYFVPIKFGPMTAYSGGYQIFWVVSGFLFVWLLPNTQELLSRYRPAFEPVDPAQPRWLWRRLDVPLSAAAGVIFGVAALSVIVYLLQGKTAEFIYFQF